MSAAQPSVRAQFVCAVLACAVLACAVLACAVLACVRSRACRAIRSCAVRSRAVSVRAPSVRAPQTGVRPQCSAPPHARPCAQPRARPHPRSTPRTWPAPALGPPRRWTRPPQTLCPALGSAPGHALVYLALGPTRARLLAIGPPRHSARPGAGWTRLPPAHGPALGSAPGHALVLACTQRLRSSLLRSGLLLVAGHRSAMIGPAISAALVRAACSTVTFGPVIGFAHIGDSCKLRAAHGRRLGRLLRRSARGGVGRTFSCSTRAR